MRGIRINRGGLYVLESVPGISGFQRWNEREYRVCGPRKAKRELSSVCAVFKHRPGHTYFAEDGHIRGHQPTILPADIAAWIELNPFGCVRIETTESEKVGAAC